MGLRKTRGKCLVMAALTGLLCNGLTVWDPRLEGIERGGGGGGALVKVKSASYQWGISESEKRLLPMGH